MELESPCRTIYSCRAFSDKNVTNDALAHMFELVRSAPSSKYLMDWDFVVVRDPATLRMLVEQAYSRSYGCNAPVAIACCVDTSGNGICGHPVSPIDAAVVVNHFTLAATAEGLSVCWIGSFREEKVKELLSIPEQNRVMDVLTLGYPHEDANPKTLLGPELVIRQEHW